MNTKRSIVILLCIGLLFTSIYTAAADGPNVELPSAQSRASSSWQKINNRWYVLSSDGSRRTGWQQVGNEWYYLRQSDGEMLTGWQQIAGKWYYLNNDGVMQTGWLQLGSTWYYLQSSGSRATGSATIDGKLEFFDYKGVWQGQTQGNQNWNDNNKQGWADEGGYWFYYQDNVRQIGWQQISGKRYHLTPAGIMQKGWQKIGNESYYFSSDGAMETGWLKLGTTWYYLRSNGVMITGRAWIDGHYHHFDNRGGWLGQE